MQYITNEKHNIHLGDPSVSNGFYPLEEQHCCLNQPFCRCFRYDFEIDYRRSVPAKYLVVIAGGVLASYEFIEAYDILQSTHL